MKNKSAQDAFEHLNDSSQKKNKSIDKMAEQFSSIEELQAYSDAQYKTILKQNEEINSLKSRVETLKQEKQTLLAKVAENSISSEGSSEQEVTNEEAACVTQIYLIKNNAMTRELTMDECKRLQIYVQTLQIIRGKEPAKSKSEKDVSNLSTEDLLKQANEALKS